MSEIRLLIYAHKLNARDKNCSANYCNGFVIETDIKDKDRDRFLSKCL